MTVPGRSETNAFFLSYHLLAGTNGPPFLATSTVGGSVPYAALMGSPDMAPGRWLAAGGHHPSASTQGRHRRTTHARLEGKPKQEAAVQQGMLQNLAVKHGAVDWG